MILCVRNQVPVENKVSDGGAQIVGWGNSVTKLGDIEKLNKANATSSAVGNLKLYNIAYIPLHHLLRLGNCLQESQT